MAEYQSMPATAGERSLLATQPADGDHEIDFADDRWSRSVLLESHDVVIGTAGAASCKTRKLGDRKKKGRRKTASREFEGINLQRGTVAAGELGGNPAGASTADILIAF